MQQAEHPGLKTIRADVALKAIAPQLCHIIAFFSEFSQADRETLIASVVADYPGFNVLINNAGIQKKVLSSCPARPSSAASLTFPPMQPISLSLIFHCVKIKIADVFDMEEMTINFEAPVHLCHLAIPHIQGKDNATM